MSGHDRTMTEPLRVSEAARRLGMSTRDVIELIYEHKLPYVMIDGIAHILENALEDYRSRPS